MTGKNIEVLIEVAALVVASLAAGLGAWSGWEARRSAETAQGQLAEMRRADAVARRLDYVRAIFEEATCDTPKYCSFDDAKCSRSAKTCGPLQQLSIRQVAAQAYVAEVLPALPDLGAKARHQLQHARLPWVDFSRMDLSQMDFFGADLRCANLEGAVLREASFKFTDLRGAILKDATLDGAKWGEVLCPDGAARTGGCGGHLEPNAVAAKCAEHALCVPLADGGSPRDFFAGNKGDAGIPCQ